MLNKSTTQLLKELESFDTFEEYENANRDSMINKNLSEYLTDLLNERNLTKASQVTVTLVGKDQFVGTQTLHRRSYGCGTAVRRLGPVDIDIIIGEHRAADRRHPDRIVFEIQFFEHFGDQLVHDPMAASRTIVHRIV